MTNQSEFAESTTGMADFDWPLGLDFALDFALDSAFALDFALKFKFAGRFQVEMAV